MTAIGTVQGLAERRGADYDPTDLRAIRALEDASAFIRGYTGQDITVVQDDSAALDGTGRAGLILPQHPATAITSVTLLEWENTVTLVEPLSYRVDRSSILWRLDWCWPYGHANVVVVYTHGYDPVPGDIAGVCYDLAVVNYSSASGATGAVTSEQIGNYQVTYDAASVSEAGSILNDDDAKAILDRYRVHK